ncbi:hypothetical protein R1sor_016257 [Riccia sorocarpa]|uniref:AAA+ ATPase domain-containing protein n=1 Tax=Riccia sorocarpa TaxID=122646 RepID=A0ABD3HEW7_9MARC
MAAVGTVNGSLEVKQVDRCTGTENGVHEENIIDGFDPAKPSEKEEENEEKGEDWLGADWEWPCYDQMYDQYDEVTGKERRDADEEKKDPFEVIYCHIKGMPWAETILVEVHSEILQKQLQKVWPDNQKLQLKTTCPVKGKDLFLKLDQLKQCLNPEINFVQSNKHEPESRTDESIGQIQLRHLIRFVEREFSETTLLYQRMKESRQVSFSMLWMFLVPGEEVVYRCSVSNEQVCGKIRKATYKKDDDICPVKWCLEVKLTTYDYDCESYRKCSEVKKVYVYQDEKPLQELEVYPYRAMENSAEIEAKLLERGALFGYLAGSAQYKYMQYNGSIFQVQKSKFFGPPLILRENADGRVMVDQLTFSKITSERLMGNAEPSSSVSQVGRVKAIDISQDPNRLYAPAIVYGFSFRLKKWGCFLVQGFSEVVFDGGSSWIQLVMDPNLKELTEHLVAEQLRKSRENEERTIDPIANKGDGCVIVCYGPPGTGKTLTAESLAEKLSAPLWSLSISELGTNPDVLEERLTRILDIAASWKAVLLLDEADIYLEKRSTSDIKRNAMCGTFLRNLEYYRGVLILTTNRIPTFDDAIRSRISVFLRYPPLTADQREKIWINLLDRAQLKDDEAQVQNLVKEMAAHELNGREIRNTIRNAQSWAQSVKEPLMCKHIITATKVLAISLVSLAENQS